MGYFEKLLTYLRWIKNIGYESRVSIIVKSKDTGQIALVKAEMASL